MYTSAHLFVRVCLCIHTYQHAFAACVTLYVYTQVCLSTECGFVAAPRSTQQWYTFKRPSNHIVLHPSLRGGVSHFRFLSSVISTPRSSPLGCNSRHYPSRSSSCDSITNLTMADHECVPHQVRMFKFEAPEGAGGEMLQRLPTFSMEACRGGNCVFGQPTCQV